MFYLTLTFHRQNWQFTCWRITIRVISLSKNMLLIHHHCVLNNLISRLRIVKHIILNWVQNCDSTIHNSWSWLFTWLGSPSDCWFKGFWAWLNLSCVLIVVDKIHRLRYNHCFILYASSIRTNVCLSCCWSIVHCLLSLYKGSPIITSTWKICCTICSL